MNADDLQFALEASDAVARAARVRGRQVDPEALIEKLYTDDPLSHEERCSLRALLDTVRGSYVYAQTNTAAANIVEAGMWGSVTAAYRYGFVTPEIPAVTG